MKKLPQRTTAISVVENYETVSADYGDGRYLPARAHPFYPGPLGSLWIRLKLAYGVFVGTYDALDYEEPK